MLRPVEQTSVWPLECVGKCTC
uniref:Uncharacterized protein n=1 Tax=Anguilla anguilla TaxID=7936 RepID=A0A0E9UM77_ANGAN